MIRMSPENLAALLSATAHDRAQRDLEDANATNQKIITAQQEEINTLRSQVAALKTKEHGDCFAQIRLEQVRIAKIIRDLFSKEAADKLLFQLALGDLR